MAEPSFVFRNSLRALAPGDAVDIRLIVIQPLGVKLMVPTRAGSAGPDADAMVQVMDWVSVKGG